MNCGVEPQKMAVGLEFSNNEVDRFYYLCGKIKALISCAIVSQMIIAVPWFLIRKKFP